MDWGCFHNIVCVFDAIDLMETWNADFERSRAVIEKRNIVLPLIVIWRGVRADQELLMVNGIKDGGLRAFSQDHLFFSDNNSMATINVVFEKSREVLEKHDLLLPMNVVWSGVRSDRKLLMMNVSKEDGWRAVSQEHMNLWRYW